VSVMLAGWSSATLNKLLEVASRFSVEQSIPSIGGVLKIRNTCRQVMLTTQADQLEGGL
jgi:hypothetical protein